jgi:hypothetical protein
MTTQVRRLVVRLWLLHIRFLSPHGPDTLVGDLAMFDAIFTIVPLVAATFISVYTWKLLFNRPHRSAVGQIDLPRGIPVRDIGIIEGELPHLHMVMVIADKVEKPTNELSDAVERNFSRGVKYLFLVSSDRASDEVRGYYTVFEALARIVVSRQENGTKKVRDLIEIQQLPYNWDDFPFIFYRLHFPNGETKTLAFRGDSMHQGIAKHYGRVDPNYARTIARAIVADAPKNVDGLSLDRDIFDVPKEAVDFPGLATKAIQ